MEAKSGTERPNLSANSYQVANVIQTQAQQQTGQWRVKEGGKLRRVYENEWVESGQNSPVNKSSKYRDGFDNDGCGSHRYTHIHTHS